MVTSATYTVANIPPIGSRGGTEQANSYYFSRISVPQTKLRETSYLSVGVHPQGNKEHPITQAMDPKKAGGIIGGVKDDGATLDC